MTREEAIEVMKAYRDKLLNSVSNQLDGDIEALKMAIQALSQKPTFDDERQKNMDEMWEKVKTEHDPCETCGYAEGSPFCLQYCPYDAERNSKREDKE